MDSNYTAMANKKSYDQVREYLNDLVGKIIKFTPEVRKTEIEFDDGMTAKVDSWQMSVQDFKDGMFKLNLDWSDPKMQADNVALMRPEFWDDNGQPTLKWVDSSYYPADHKDSFYFDIDTSEVGHSKPVFKLVTDTDSLSYLNQALKNILKAKDLMIPEHQPMIVAIQSNLEQAIQKVQESK